MSYISIKELNKSFTKVKALSNINISIEKGEFISLLGPSGCGKSTLLRIIAGLESLSTGEILVNNNDLVNTPVNKRNMGMVFQSYSLFPNMTTQENIAFGLKLKKVSKEEIEKKVQEIIDLVGLQGREDHYPNQLSGGQQQRVALARALVVNPDVLLLDEPLSALDAQIRVSLRKLIKEIHKKFKITTLFVTHDQEEALSISDRIFVMDKGEIVQQGTPEQIYKHPESKFVANFIGTYNFLKPEFFKESESNGEILIRPEHIEITSEEAGTNENIFSGTISNVYFLGNVVRLNVLVNDTMILVDALNSRNEVYFEGEKINLRFLKDKYMRLK
ncbi:ABC transporter ATP-binding protein [Clostridium sp. BL-8]|uniref:ABC transporter ATP-binding protein n=1 Tax=Clostridium sp. BL-8 TaxID=349938 RepID=UPI00098CA7FE|nr:ABC transporter ATP-binding protein [Clostridium sp. BL-8]OOM72002.1 sulfate/thiosulfate import ATP-binding protein CysA [Clostridium sp. BL-8]